MDYPERSFVKQLGGEELYQRCLKENEYGRYAFDTRSFQRNWSIY